MKTSIVYKAIVLFGALVLFSFVACSRSSSGLGNRGADVPSGAPDGTDWAAWIAERRAEDPSLAPEERYRGLPLVDAHNHDAGGDLNAALAAWDRSGVRRTVLFGAISEPAARNTDERSFEFYAAHPDRVLPFFAAVPLGEPNGIEEVRSCLERGYFGIGEIVGASTQSPVTANLEWKAEYPDDADLQAVYDLATQYGTPVLLHVDPTQGPTIAHLEQALDRYPGTTIIFAHANAYNSPQALDRLLAAHHNLWIDFFAGFTAYNPESANTLADFVPVIERYPDRVVLGTDSGYAIGYARAVRAIYELIDLLSPDTAVRAAFRNIEGLVERQGPTRAQYARIEELSRRTGAVDTAGLNKREAHELIFRLEARL